MDPLRKHRCPYCQCPRGKVVRRLMPGEELTLKLARRLVDPPFGDHAWLRRTPWETEVAAAEFIAKHSEGQRMRVLHCIAMAKDTKGRLDYEVHLRTDIHKNDVASRRNELVERGWVKPLPDVHRPTANSTGMAWAMTAAGRMVWEHDIEPYL